MQNVDELIWNRRQHPGMRNVSKAPTYCSCQLKMYHRDNEKVGGLAPGEEHYTGSLWASYRRTCFHTTREALPVIFINARWLQAAQPRSGLPLILVTGYDHHVGCYLQGLFHYAADDCLILPEEEFVPLPHAGGCASCQDDDDQGFLFLPVIVWSSSRVKASQVSAKEVFQLGGGFFPEGGIPQIRDHLLGNQLGLLRLGGSGPLDFPPDFLINCPGCQLRAFLCLPLGELSVSTDGWRFSSE